MELPPREISSGAHNLIHSQLDISLKVNHHQGPPPSSPLGTKHFFWIHYKEACHITSVLASPHLLFDFTIDFTSSWFTLQDINGFGHRYCTHLACVVSSITKESEPCYFCWHSSRHCFSFLYISIAFAIFSLIHCYINKRVIIIINRFSN